MLANSQPSANDSAKFTTTSKVPVAQLNLQQPAKCLWLSQVYDNQQNTNDTAMFATASQMPMAQHSLQEPEKYQWLS